MGEGGATAVRARRSRRRRRSVIASADSKLLLPLKYECAAEGLTIGLGGLGTRDSGAAAIKDLDFPPTNEFR